MRSTTPSRRRRAALRAVAGGVLVALGIGLAPAPALATEPLGEPVAGALTGATGDVPTDPAPPALMAVLASAHQASVTLDGFGVHLTTDEVGMVLALLAPVVELVQDPPDGIDVGVEDVLVAVEELRQALEVAAAGALVEAERLRVLAQEIADDLTGWAFDQVAAALAELPTAEEVLALARDVEAFVRGEAEETAQALLTDLAEIAGFLTDEQHPKAVKDAVTTVLLVLSDVVDPLPDTLAPTAEASFTASGELTRWADELVQQAVGPGEYEPQPEPVEGEEPAEVQPPVDTEVWVGEEPVVVTGPAYGSSWPAGSVPAQEEPGGGGAVGRCYMPGDRKCTPPLVYSGGKVVRNPVVRAVFVGSYWDDKQTLRGAIDNLFGNMSGSGYQAVLSQYYDSAGYISRSVTYSGHHVLDVTPPSVVSDETIAGYAARAAKQRGWTSSDSVVWVVMLPPDTVSAMRHEDTDNCGHQVYATSGTRTYILAVVEAQAECVGVSSLSAREYLTWIASHEYAGAVTDPFNQGWHDQSISMVLSDYRPYGYHLPDLCQMLPLTGPGGERVEHLWSNAENRCASSFTPRWSYEVTGMRKPAGDGGAPTGYTRGHSYGVQHDYAEITVVNTGNIDWIHAGSKKTYLRTANNACSPFYDTARTRVGWKSCRRIDLFLNDAVSIGEAHTFEFTLRPDGSLPEGRQDLTAAFTVVAGTTVIPNSGSTPATLSGIDLHRFDATVVAARDVGHVAAGQYGADTRVRITLRNTGGATWYPDEVVYIGTPQGTTSRYAAASWPRSKACGTGCRAHRVTTTDLTAAVPPGGFYSFDLVLHIPDDKSTVVDTAVFFPYADVPEYASNTIKSTQVFGAEIKVRIVMRPGPVAAHEVTGDAFAGGGDDGDEVAGGDGGFSCLAVGGTDAVSTAVTSCTAEVTTATGAVHTASAAAARYDGRFAVTRGTVPYDPAAGDVITVCWTVTATFLDGTDRTDSGCRA